MRGGPTARSKTFILLYATSGVSRAADIRKVSDTKQEGKKGERKRKIRNNVIKNAENMKQEGNKTKTG
jgi:hypothetical protein